MADGSSIIGARLLDDFGITKALRTGNPRRYAITTSDGTRLIARYWPSDNAAIPIVLCDGLGCDGYTWPYILQRFAGERPIFHLQWRGHGESDVPDDLDTVQMRVIVDDLSRALAQFGIDDAIMFGHSMGVPIALESWRAQNERGFHARIHGLALMCGVFENPIRTWHGPFADHAPTPLGNVVINLIFDMATNGVINRWQQLKGGWKKLVVTDFAYNATAKGELNPALVREEDFRPYLDHLSRMDMRVFARLAQDMRAHSALEVLSTINAPTLIVGGARDKFAPPWISEAMHHHIRDSELLMLAEGSHVAPIEQPRLVERAVLRLLHKVDKA